MRKFLFTAILLSAAAFAFAQQVVSTTGSTSNNSGYVVDWALGEPVSETVSDGASTLTQGFLQSQIVVTAVDKFPVSGVTVTAFPNPTTGIINVHVQQATTQVYSYRIETMEGKLVNENHSFSGNGQINIETLISGMYLLTISPEDNRWAKKFKIVKR